MNNSKSEKENNVITLTKVLPDYQMKVLSKMIDKKYFDMKIMNKTSNIVEGSWVLTPEEKSKAIEYYFYFDRNRIKDLLKNFKPSELFLETLNKANTSKHKINIISPSILDLKLMSTNIFRTINVKETLSDKEIIRNDDGTPVKKLGFLQYKQKEKGEIVWNKNLSNFNTFFNAFINITKEDLKNPFINGAFTNVISHVNNNATFDLDMFASNDLVLYISSKPEDILNMSNSKYYSSCQNLYSGGYRQKLPSNIFDRNMKIAYLMFPLPYIDPQKNKIPFHALSRTIIRNIRGEIFFDTTYPGQMRDFFTSIITKYTKMENKYVGSDYFFTDVGLTPPYMDHLSEEAMPINPNAQNDVRIVELAKVFNEEPEFIHPSKDSKNSKEYTFDNGKYAVLSESETNCATINFITHNMVFRQDSYLPYVDVKKFYNENKDGILNGYDGEADIVKIVEWADKEPLEVKKTKKKEKSKDSKADKKRCNITKHNLYRVMRPYINPLFFEERLSNSSIRKTRKKLSVDDTEIKTENFNIFHIS